MNRPLLLPRSPLTLAPLCLTLLCLTQTMGCAYTIIREGAIDPESLARIEANTSDVRWITPRTPYEVEVISTQELATILEAEIDRQFSARDFRDFQDVYTVVGLWPPDRDLRTTFLAVLDESIAGLYLPERRTLYVVEDTHRPFMLRVASASMRRDFMMEFVLSHEIVHALQHSEYPEWFDATDQYRDQDDLMAALQAALEGDAMYFGLESMAPGIKHDPEQMRRSTVDELNASRSQAFDRAPLIIKVTLLFPYVEGYTLAQQEKHQLLEHPPASTEQVLHADKRRELFLAIDLAAAEASLPEGCAPLHRNTLGELSLSVLFRDLSDEPAPSAWEGWDGDRLLVARCGDRPEFVWLTHWDSERDAIEFEDAYGAIRERVAERAGMSRPPTTRREGRQVIIHTEGLRGLAGRASALARSARVGTPEELLDHFEKSP